MLLRFYIVKGEYRAVTVPLYSTGRLLRRQGFLHTHVPQIEFVGSSFGLSCMGFCCAAVTQLRHVHRRSVGAWFSQRRHGRVEPFRRIDKPLHTLVRSCRSWTIVVVKAVLLHGAMGDIGLCEPRAADSAVYHVAGAL